MVTKVLSVLAASIYLAGCSNSMKPAKAGGADSASISTPQGGSSQPASQTGNNSNSNSGSVGSVPPPVSNGKCGLQTNTSNVAFCETFDKPNPVTGRSGEIDQRLWGVSRGGLELNMGSPWAWANSKIDVCGTIMDATSPSDVRVCNGRMVEATNDNISGQFENGGVMMMTMYPKQPFDWSGRTGTVAFDITNDTTGTHGSWPEFWVTDQPVPLPITHFSVHGAPANAFGIRLAGSCSPGQACACGNTDNSYRFTVSSAVVVRDWFVEDVGDTGCDFGDNTTVCVKTGMQIETLGCVKQASGPNGGMNHIELKVSQNQIEVYATDAGTTAPLKKIAIVKNANLPLSRGFIWLEDKHYNADKGDHDRPSQRNHTYSWDNIAFDGPVVARDLSFDVLDSLVLGTGFRYLGWETSASKPVTLTTLPMGAADIVAAKTANLLFTFYHYDAPKTFTFSINGHVHNAAFPFPESDGFTYRTISLPFPISDLVMGPNKIVIYSDQTLEVANVNISLAGAAGIVLPVVK